MDEQRKQRLEYEQQFFGFSSDFFAESFQNFVKDELESSVDTLIRSIRNKLINESKNPEAFDIKIQEMQEKLKCAYNSSLSAEYDTIKEQISKYMTIPDHVLLKEDLPVKTGLKTNLLAIENEIHDLKGRYNAVNYVKQKITEEIENADAAIFIMDSIVDQKTVDGMDFKIMNVDEMLSLAQTNLSILK